MVSSQLGCITRNEVDSAPPTAEFTVLLKDFIIGQSQWSANLLRKPDENQTTTFTIKPDCYEVSGGLILNFKTTLPNHAEITLSISYQPGSGLDSEAVAQSSFTLSR